ncbi:MAG: trehalose-6-phosphate synthase [Rhizobiaceae bacterium]|nr:trehalose-6-phosphate synthase [Rhizobiaceae bacterium]
MSRLIVVSNRVADLRKGRAQSGGLAVALADVLGESGGVWVGGEAGSGEGTRRERAGSITCLYVGVPAVEYDRYYLGYSNSVLWPLFHYRADLVDYRSDHFDAYLAVNRRFAAALRDVAEPDDLVWVHDYQLMPAAAFLREAGWTGRMGFFLHIPFPPPEILAATPNHAFIVSSLLAHDVVGFQTTTDLGNFLRCVREYGLGEVTGDDTVVVDGRTVVARRFPIGIDVDGFAQLAGSASEDIRIDRMRRDILGRRQAIGVDRLDYSKGLPARFEAFGRLLAEHPELERMVSLVQIAPPTRQDIAAYADIRAELEKLSGAVNGRFAEFDWTPIKYIHRAVPRDKLAALLRSSEVGLVTPLRDGMNLVAKEYVAAQDSENPGVLVLSQFAGAAEELTDALLVNPYDTEAMAQVLYRALTMPAAERRERHGKLLAAVRASDVSIWRDRFLAALRGRPRVVDSSAGPVASSAA